MGGSGGGGWVTVVSGSAGGLMEAIVCQPLDVVKTRLQLERAGGKYHGMRDCFRSIYQMEGWRALYRGLTPFSFHLVTKYALRFGTYSAIHSRSPNALVAGAVAGAVEAVVVVTPCEVVKTRLQQRNSVYRNTLECLRGVVLNEGPTALLRGVTPTIVRQASNQASNFFVVDWFNRRVWHKRDARHMLPLWQTAVSGIIAGAVGPTLNHPFDVVKSRMMAQNSVYVSNGVSGTLRRIVAEEGIGALYRGFCPRLARVAPGQMVTWMTVLRMQSLLSF
jgi:solute carrier family 25 (mitochondrial citrate transporter), member 1